jgi:hypothetical protein
VLDVATLNFNGDELWWLQIGPGAHESQPTRAEDNEESLRGCLVIAEETAATKGYALLNSARCTHSWPTGRRRTPSHFRGGAHRNRKDKDDVGGLVSAASRMASERRGPFAFA